MMDAVEFVKTLGRMCNVECTKCEFWKRRSNFESCAVWQKDHPEEAVAIVEQWATKHPAKTRQSEFLKQWPEAALSKDGAIAICPLAISAAYRHGNGACNKDNSDTCADCKRQFWLAEVEE